MIADLAILAAAVHGDNAAGALAVAGEKIIAVGDESVRAAIGPRTEVISAPNALVLPGFIDAHVHPSKAGRNLLTVDLSVTEGRDGYLAAVRDHVLSHPGDDWITGGGWAMEYFPGGLPDRQALDAVTGERPAFLYNRDVHGAWVNSAALRAGGITAGAPDPPDGRIERDAAGEPTGMLHEGAAYSFESTVLPPVSVAQWEQAILAGQRHLHRLGVTGWQDAWVEPDQLTAYRNLDAAGLLTSRVVGALWWDRHRGLEQVADLIARRGSDPLPGSRFRATTVKIMVDGVLENHTGAMLEPYCGCGAERGLTYLEREILDQAVVALDAAGFQVHLHAIGDRAVRMALDAVQAAREANGFAPVGGPGDHRHHIAHLQVVHPSDIPRFAALGVTANLQAFWAQHEAQMDELTVPFLGERRSAQQYPFESLRRAGARLAMGSDWGVTTADPLAQLAVAVTRRDPQTPQAPVFLPAERLSRAAAIEAFTAGSAYVNHDADAGRLAVGARADLVLLDRDIRSDQFSPAEAELLATVIAGRISPV